MILDQDYIDSYSRDFSQIICDNHFTHRKYISGQEIIELTHSFQLNLMVIRELFEDWQKQTDSFSKNPYFDFQDNVVKEALSTFMNVLSRSIKIEKIDFEPLLGRAVGKTILLAVDPVTFIESVLEEGHKEPASYVKELKKYIKWYRESWVPAAEDWAADTGSLFWKQKLYEGFEKESDDSSQPLALLAPLQEVLTLNFDTLIKDIPEESKPDVFAEVEKEVEEEPKHYIVEKTEVVIEEQEVESSNHIQEDEAPTEKRIETIDPSIVWAKFDAEENPYMKGSISHLKEGMGINQRIMFTKRLFQGNPDLMDQAIFELDATDSFFEAIDLLNRSFVLSLNWDIHSEEVLELLQLIFRKYDEV
ncbi:hypothetical protein ADICYQ_4368 [Cyclobacterium qasimii M12-11B]|nr:hypothetical protein ADICYQ_4368 [Cyclobacterium qasimii M12-11B]